MKMIFEMQYLRKEKFIYKREEICSIFRSDDIEQIIAKNDYIVSIDFERFVYLRSTLPPQGKIMKTPYEIRDDVKSYFH